MWEVIDIPMRVNRTLLYSGVFVAAIGAALMAANLGQASANALIEILGLWPVAVIAIGVGIVLMPTRLSLAGGVLAAAAPGLLLGGLLALSPRLAVDSGYWDELRAVYQHYQQCHDVDTHVDFGNVQFDSSGGCK
jgi:hypothetical protein